jgi:hypothetical protein
MAPPGHEGWLRSEENSCDSHLNSAAGVVVQVRLTFSILIHHPVRSLRSHPLLLARRGNSTQPGVLMPFRSMSMALTSLACRVSSFFASVSQRQYSLRCV